MAASEGAIPGTQVFTPEKSEQAKQLLADLMHLLGDSSEEDKASTPKPSGKNMADVANRVIDIVSKSTATIAETVQKAAPEVWKIMVKQQFASALANLIAPIGTIVLVVIAAAVCTSVWPKPVYDSLTVVKDGETANGGFYAWYFFFRIVPIVTSVVAGGVLINEMTRSVKKMINSPYYATRDLLQMLLGRSIPE